MPEDVVLQKKFYETPDLSFAAYLLMKGFVLIGANKSSKSGDRYKFVFEYGDEDAIEKVGISYVNSESYQFDLNARTLRNMVKSNKRIA